MDRLAKTVLLPEHPDHPRRWKGVAQWLLYIRSHYLRMPPHLLIAHLARKSWRSMRKRRKKAPDR
jgi:hypothetical protein